MPFENPRTKKIQHYQNLYAYTGIVRNLKWHEYYTSSHESHFVVYAGSSYFPSNHPDVYMLLYQKPC